MGGPLFKIRLAHGVRVFLSENEFRLVGTKAKAVLGLTALQFPNAIRRDRLCALLWSERDQQTARTSLRQTLKRLKDGLGEAADRLLETTVEEIAIRPGVADIDVAEALEELASGEVPQLLQIDPESLANLLEGMDYADPATASWLAVARQRKHQDAIDALGDILESGGANAGIAAETLRKMEPTHERASRFVMRRYHETGQSAKALTVYADLWRELDSELDINPSTQTQELAVQIKSECGLNFEDPGIPQPILADEKIKPQSVEAFPQPKSHRDLPAAIILVEPFDVGYLPDSFRLYIKGLRLEFIAALTRFREWKVLDSEASSFGSAQPGIVLTGVASEHDDGWKVDLRLVEFATKQIIWDEKISSAAAGVSTAQIRTIKRIALALNVHLTSTRLARTPRSADLGLDEGEAWLLGQALLSHWRPQSERRAEALFRGLIETNENFPPAYVGLAQVLNTRHFIQPGVYRSLKTHREALSLSLRAVSMDPLDAKAHLTLAWSYALNEMWDTAAETFRLACNLNENDSWTLISAALGLAYTGALDEARALSEEMPTLGLGVTPLQWGYYSGVQFLAGDYVSAAQAATRVAGATVYSSAWQVASLAKAGRLDEAELMLQALFADCEAHWAVPETPTPTEMTRWLLHAYPICSDESWKIFRDGLHVAGAPFVEERPRLVT